MAKKYQSMDDAYNKEKKHQSSHAGGKKVSNLTIAKIKDMGMSAALKKAGTSSNKEFVTGVSRMYGARRVAAAKGKASDSRIQKPSLSKTPKRPGALTAKMGTSKAKPKKPTGGLFPGLLPGGKKPSSGGLKPGALGFLKNKYEKK